MVGPKTTEAKSPSRQAKSPGRSKSPGRPRSPGRAKKAETKKEEPPKSPVKAKSSPTKNKSPSRGRPKSPSRDKSKPSAVEKAKSKSPTKEAKEEKSKGKPERTGRLTPTRRSPIKKNKAVDDAVPILKKKGTTFDTDTDSDTALDEVGTKEKPKATVKGRSRIDAEVDNLSMKEANESIEIGGSLIKRVTRSQNREVERIVHLNKQFELPRNKLGEFSDEDELINKDTSKNKSLSPKKKSKFNWAAVGTNVLTLAVIIGIPVSVGIALSTCNKDSCVITKIPKNLPVLLKPTAYFDQQSILAYLAYFTLSLALSAIPIGFKVDGLPDKQGKLTYHANGILVALILVFVCFGLEMRQISVSNFIINHLFHLFVAALGTGLVTSIFAYVRSFYVPVSALNPRIIGKGRVENFFWGRETHPRLFGRVDLKLFLARLALVGILLIDLAYIIKGVTTTIVSQPQLNETSTINLNLVRSVNPTPVLYFSLHLLYALDRLYYEKQWISSTIQQEGFGYNFAVLSSVCPFASALVTKYVIEHKVSLATWQLVLAGVVGILGLVYQRLCNKQRDGFLRNPYSPQFKRHDSISTTQGTKILTSGFYTYVRFPHYLGEILTNLSLVPFVLCATPVFVFYGAAVALICRAHRDDTLAKQKFGNAWDRYCHKAKHLLLKKVY